VIYRNKFQQGCAILRLSISHIIQISDLKPDELPAAGQSAVYYGQCRVKALMVDFFTYCSYRRYFVWISFMNVGGSKWRWRKKQLCYLSYKL